MKDFDERLGSREVGIRLLRGETDRYAVARACIGYADGHIVHTVMGEIAGTITDAPRGGEGIGFDYYFIPCGYTETFSEMGRERKGQISHRGNAIRAFSAWYLAYRERGGLA